MEEGLGEGVITEVKFEEEVGDDIVVFGGFGWSALWLE